ncbi:hypothetical protein DH2020_033937 [Rehmannia glutinosa]|uniref:Uncharacterized protein n=1 Tax=Rehmannia glutinosa TaxID=99300 RepID=A0ABR0VBD5_REHGL
MMTEGSGEVEDELIDLNKEPVERKRKRVEKSNSADKGNEGSDGLPKTGRVLRSRTVAMSDGEKQVIKMEIVKMEDGDGNQVPVMEHKDESEVPVLHKTKKKGKRGRPPKLGGKCQVASLGNRKEGERVDESSNGTGRGRGRPKVKGKREGHARLRMRIWEQKQLVRDQIVAKVGTNDLGDGVMRQKKRTVVSGKGKEMGLREQKQLLRDQIVAMLMKAGWTVEYRERISREYRDAVYVDREGRGYWSVTLAYKKFKERIDKGTASEQDILAFTPIPDETLGILFRVTVKGRKAGKKKNGAGRTIKTKTKKESSKSNSNGRIKPRLNRGSQRTLLARRPRDGSDGDNNELYEEKRTLLSWMIDLGTVPLGGKVKYKRGRGRGRKILLEGRIVKEGICCDCCNITHRIRDFESHAESTPGKPYENIYLDSGISLFQCLVDSWKKHAENDSIGFVCVDVEGDDPNDDTCNVFLLETGNVFIVHANSVEWPFTCIALKRRLLKILTMEIDPSVGRNALSIALFSGDASLNGDSSKVESNSKLAVAFSVMDECFEPIIDERSGTNMIHNVVYNCGSNIRRLNYEGFYTIILEKGDEVVAAASIRLSIFDFVLGIYYNSWVSVSGDAFYWNSIYVPPRDVQPLLTSIEMVLSSLGVEKLVIPAISELNETWTKIFGFHPLEESKRQEMRYMSMIAFPGVDMLQKPLVGHQSAKGQMNSAVRECTEVRPDHPNMQETASNICSDLKIQNCGEAAESKSDDNTYDAHATESKSDDNTYDALATESKSDDNTYDAPATVSTEVQTHHQNTQEEQGEDNGGIATSNCDISPKIEISNNNKVAPVESGASMPVSSLNEEDIKNANVGEYSENGDCINDLDTSKDNDISLETNTAVDCNLETKQQSAEETDTCPNGFLLENEKTGNCGCVDISEGNVSGRET